MMRVTMAAHVDQPPAFGRPSHYIIGLIGWEFADIAAPIALRPLRSGSGRGRSARQAEGLYSARARRCITPKQDDRIR